MKIKVAESNKTFQIKLFPRFRRKSVWEGVPQQKAATISPSRPETVR